jgi:hypothetical protein
MAALTACDLGLRTARLPQASFLFLTILATLAFWPYSSLGAVGLAVPIPLEPRWARASSGPSGVNGCARGRSLRRR